MNNNPEPINFFENAVDTKVAPNTQMMQPNENVRDTDETDQDTNEYSDDREDVRFNSTTTTEPQLQPLPGASQASIIPEDIKDTKVVRRSPFPKVRTIDRKMVDAVNQMSHRPSDQASLTITHSFLNRRFGYNLAELCSQIYEPPDVSQPTKTAVHLCLYQVNAKVPMSPFLCFALEYGEQSVGFSSIEFTYAESEGGDPTRQFTSACYQKIFEIMAVEPTPDMTIEHIASLTQFRGIYTSNEDSKGDELYAFFEISPAHADALTGSANVGTTTGRMAWATIHEIANTQTIRDVPVAPATRLVFTLEPELMYIKNEIGIPVDIPFVLYATEMSAEGAFSLILNSSVFVPQFEHPFGYYSFFSDYAPSVPATEGEPNPEKSEVGHPISRYVVFADNVLYLVGTEEENKKTYAQTLSNMHFSGIYLQDATGTPRWGVRTVDAYMLLD